jgi:serine/threonine protein kinase
MKRKNYKVEARIGAGGMGEVFRAFDKANSRTVAIKILPGDLSSNQEVKTRFLREMEVCSTLKHKNVISLYDYGESEGTLFFVMEYIDGPSIAQHIEKEGQSTPEFALTVTEHILEALHYVHSKDLIHRDLKPANILVEGEGENLRAILMDFGLVKNFDSQLTMTGKVIGTPRYIAPEMLTTGTVDHRSDIFQLGIVLYEMLAGGYAFKGTTRPEVVRNCLTLTPEPVSQINPLVNVDIDNLIFNAIEKDPDCRYSSATEMLVALRACRRGERIVRRKGQRPLPSKAIPFPVDAASPLVNEPAIKQKQKPVLPPVIGGPVKLQPVSFDTDIDIKLKSEKHGIFFALFSLFLLIPLSLFLIFGGETQYTIKDMAIAPGLTQVEMSWYSKEPYPSRIQYGRTSSGMALTSLSSELTCNHAVTLDSLEENSNYVFNVVFPNGRMSPEYSFRTSSFSIENLQWKYSDGGLLDIGWKTTVPAKSVLIQNGGGKEKAVPELDYAVIHRIVSEPVDVMSDITFFIRYTLKDGVSGESKSTLVPSIFKLGSELEARLSRFNKGNAVRRVLNSPGTSSDVSKLVREQPFFASLQEFIPVANTFFASDSVPLSARYNLYVEIADCIALDVVSTGNDPVTALFKKALGGVFNFSEVAQMGRGSTMSITLPLPADNIIGVGGSAVSSLSTPILYRTDGKSKVCELSAVLKGMSRQTLLKVTVNKDYVLSIYNLAANDKDVSVTYNHLFPASLMVDGTNVLTFRTEQVGGAPSKDMVEIEDVSINFQ